MFRYVMIKKVVCELVAFYCSETCHVASEKKKKKAICSVFYYMHTELCMCNSAFILGMVPVFRDKCLLGTCAGVTSLPLANHWAEKPYTPTTPLEKTSTGSNGHTAVIEV